MDSQNLIRDFIYINVEKLYSLYSQVFGGVAEQIMKSVESGLTRGSTQKSSPTKGKGFEEQVSDVSREIETTVLYDNMYNRLETKLANLVYEPKAISRDNFQQQLEGVSFVKTTGIAEFEDYSRLEIFLEQFNVLGAGLTHAEFISAEHAVKIETLQQAIREEQDPTQKAQLQATLKLLKDEKAYAKFLNLHQDEKVLSVLGILTRLFAKDGFQLAIDPMGSDGSTIFLGALDKQWLRVSPDLLRALSKGGKQPNMTMVGQITYLPDEELLDPTAVDPAAYQAKPEASFRDRMRIMFSAMSALDKMYFQSSTKVEIAISPIAIYRESSLESFKEANREE